MLPAHTWCSSWLATSWGGSECTFRVHHLHPLLPQPGVWVEKLVLLSCGCCWAPLGCLFPRGFTRCVRLHPGVAPVQQALVMPPALLKLLLRWERLLCQGQSLILRCSAVLGLQVIIKALFIPFLFPALLRKAVAAEATGGVVGAALSAPALLFKVDTSRLLL